MVTPASTTELADALIACQDHAGTLAPITSGDPTFDVPRAYEVLAAINARREAQGWMPVGRKIGFTNRTIWERYGVYQPMWAPVWSHSVHFAEHGAATLPLAGFVRPRIEPEVVFKLGAAPRSGDDSMALIAAVEWIAAGFEIVQSIFPDWRFSAADCTAAGRLFDSMVSVRGDQRSDAPHLGLGLYIVRLIAEAHRGRATAQNRDDGRGVVVSVMLPYATMS